MKRTQRICILRIFYAQAFSPSKLVKEIILAHGQFVICESIRVVKAHLDLHLKYRPCFQTDFLVIDANFKNDVNL